MSLNWVVIRRQGCAWAVPASAISRVAAAGAGCTLEVGTHELAADEVLGTPRSLVVKTIGNVLHEVVPAGCSGLSVWKQEPVVVIDPENPPIALRAGGIDHQGNAVHEESDDAF